MMPLPTHPLASIALTAIPALVAIYLFRNVFKPRTVSSLFLWRALNRPSEGGVRRNRLRLPLIFLLELLAILMLVAAAVEPRWPGGANTGVLVAVLDDSASMRAGLDGVSFRDKARDALLREATSGQFRHVRLVLAGPQPAPLGGSLGSAADVRRALAGWTCQAPSAAMEAAIATALELGGTDASVLALTDHAPAHDLTGGRVRWEAFGRSLPNVAFVNASRSAGATADRCLFEVANFGDAPARAILSSTGLVAVAARHEFELAPRQTRRFVLPAAPDAEQVCAFLEPDALAIDNAVCLLRRPARSLTLQNTITNQVLRGLVARAVAASGIQVASVDAAADLLFTDNPAAVPARQTWVVHFLDRGKRAAYAGPFVLDTSHPLVDGLDLDGVVWGAGDTPVLPGNAVVLAGNLPLVTDEEKGGGAHDLHVRFCPERSTLQETPDWPALIVNLLQWRLDQAVAVRPVNARVGGAVTLAADPAWTSATVLAPDGAAAVVPLLHGGAVVPVTQPGLHRVELGGKRHAFFANVLAASESDLSTCSSGSWGDWRQVRATQRRYGETAWIFLLLALACLLLHQRLIARGGGVV